MSRKLSDELGKRFPLGMRTTKALREKMEAAAAASGRSLAQEAEFRLERSFADTDMALIIREQIAAVLQPAVEQAIERAIVAYPEPISSPMPGHKH